MYLIRERFFRLGEDSDITDEQGQPVLHVDGEVLTLHDPAGPARPGRAGVAQVHRKLVTLRPTYQISVAGHRSPRSASTCSRLSLTSSRSTSPAPTTWR